MRYYSQVILADYPQTYYQLDETSGTTATDASPNANNGTYNASGVTYNVTGAIAKDSDTAVTFDGTAGYMAFPSGVNPAGLTAFSVELWFNPTSLVASTFHRIISNANTGSSNVGFDSNLNGSTGRMSWNVGNGSANATVTTIGALSTGTWYHIVGTYDGSNMRLYLNGTLQQTTPLTGGIGTSASPINIGRNPAYSGDYIAASFDEVAVYPATLNQSQVSSHYTAGLAQLLANYYYGAFQLNEHPGGLGYYLMTKDLDFAEMKPVISPLALYDGTKITGYQVPQRQIQCDIYVIGSSRADCIARKDTMESYLAKRDQSLILHEDGRSWIANAISGKAKFAAGQGVVQAKIPVIFVCANPYATSAFAATPFDTGSVAYTTVVVAGTWQSSIFSVAGGGTIYSWPTLTLTHKLASPGSTTLNGALTSGNVYTSITVVSSPALTAGQVITLSWTTGGNTFVQKLTVSGTVTGGATSIPVNSFTASASFPITSTTVSISTAWNSVTIAQLTDNYQIQASSTGDKTYTITGGNSVATGIYLLPQGQNDFITIVCDPTASNGWTITGSVQGVSFTYQPNGAFPPLESTTTQWQVTVTSDNAPTADLKISWSPRYAS